MTVGYGLAFADQGSGGIGGLGKVFLHTVTEGSLWGNIPEIAFALFQGTFAIITPALIVGGFAERRRFSAVLIFIVLSKLNDPS